MYLTANSIGVVAISHIPTKKRHRDAIEKETPRSVQQKAFRVRICFMIS